MQNKKAISPVIGALLLVVLVVVIGGIVFLWGRGFVENARGADFEGEPAERACERIKFEAGIFYDEGSGDYNVEINNQGDIDIYGFKILIEGDGKTDSLELLDENVLAGQAKGLKNRIEIDLSGREIEIIPLIVAEASNGADIVFHCPEIHGKKIAVV